ncbi:MAG: V-type ATP synthase subunit C [Clostridia bacterium]|nr:V-type ATP synthase subunit C [Clostridia bacterium]
MPVKGAEYAYAVGRIRVLETRLLDEGRLDRMVESSSVDEAFKILGETEYAHMMAEVESVYDFEEILQAELERIHLLMQEINPQAHLTDLISLKYDFHNLKVLLKGKYLKETGGAMDDLLLPMGTIPLEDLQALIFDEEFQEDDYELPEEVCRAVEEIAEEFEASGDPQLIDLSLDRTLYEMLVGRAKELKSTVLEELFVREVDLTNIKTFLRVKRMGRDRRFLRRTMLPHGRLPVDLFSDLLDEPLEALAESLEKSQYADLADVLVREWQEKGNVTGFEKLADNMLIDHLRQVKYTTLGLEPLLGYLYAKETEIKNIRIILVGKVNGLPMDEIKERLRNVYV